MSILARRESVRVRRGRGAWAGRTGGDADEMRCEGAIDTRVVEGRVADVRAVDARVSFGAGTGIGSGFGNARAETKSGISKSNSSSSAET